MHDRVSETDFGLGIGGHTKLIKTTSTHVYPHTLAHDDAGVYASARANEARISIGADVSDNVGPSVEDFVLCPSDVNRFGVCIAFL